MPGEVNRETSTGHLDSKTAGQKAAARLFSSTGAPLLSHTQTVVIIRLEFDAMWI